MDCLTFDKTEYNYKTFQKRFLIHTLRNRANVKNCLTKTRYETMASFFFLRKDRPECKYYK